MAGELTEVPMTAPSPQAEVKTDVPEPPKESPEIKKLQEEVSQEKENAAKRDEAAREAATEPKKNEEPKVTDRASNDARYSAIFGELYAEAKTQATEGKTVDISSVTDKALTAYYKEIAHDYVQKGVLEKVVNDKTYQQELGRLLSAVKPGETVDRDKLAEEAFANFIRAKDLEIINENDPKKKKTLIDYLTEILTVVVASTVQEVSGLVIPRAR